MTTTAARVQKYRYAHVCTYAQVQPVVEVTVAQHCENPPRHGGELVAYLGLGGELAEEEAVLARDKSH